jgi:hypothetical protein
MILHRRKLLQMLAVSPLFGCSTAQAKVYHDPECGCCKKWMDLLAKDGRYSLQTISATDRSALHRQIGMPRELASCHTAIIDGYAFEGHVPLNDVARLLAQRPTDISGLAVPGMPLGSPGMEAPARAERFAVIAFGRNGQEIFANY